MFFFVGGKKIPQKNVPIQKNVFLVQNFFFVLFNFFFFWILRYGQFSMKPKPITRKIEIAKMLFNTFCSFHKNLTTSEGWVCISLVRKMPKKKLRHKSYRIFLAIFLFQNLFPQNLLKRPRKNSHQNRSKILLKQSEIH